MEIDLANLLTIDGIDRKTVELLLLASSSNPVMPKDLTALAIEHGFIRIKKWNISQILKNLGGNVSRFKTGYAINKHGTSKLAECGLLEVSPTKNPQLKLRDILKNISDDKSKKFIEEAVSALEFGLLRSSVVLSWVGAVSVLQKHIFDNHLQDFNNELIKRNNKAKPIKTIDDLGLIKEYEFLQILKAIGVFGKNVKEELEVCLKLRNSCGHPSGLKFADHRVASHLEVLLLNVFENFN